MHDHETPALVHRPRTEPHEAGEVEDWRIAAANEIVDKQYFLYSWNDNKTTTLITSNSVLFAAVGFLFESVLDDRIALVALLLSLLFVGVSLAISLLQVSPQYSSGRTGTNPNIRSLRGIATFNKWEDYERAFLRRSKSEYFSDSCRQIYGMMVNNDQSRGTTKNAVRLTLLAIALILFAAGKVGYSHLKTFEAQTSQAAGIVGAGGAEEKPNDADME